MQQTIGNQATAHLLQRVPGDQEPDAGATPEATAGGGVEAPVRSPGARFPLHGTVGPDGENHPDDVAAVRARLDELGFDAGAWLGHEPGYFDPDLGAAILAFQRAEVRAMRHDGIVTPGGRTHSALAIGRQPGAGELDEDLDATVDASTHPAVVHLRSRIAEAERLQAECATRYSQEQGEARDRLVQVIGEIRGEIDALADSDLPADQFESVAAWGHRRLNRASPYYLQSTNADFLDEPGSGTRTCNLTCLAMCLEALGVSAADYSGDREVLREIRGHGGNAAGDYDYELAFDRAKDVVGDDDIDGLRLPDFLQLVFVGRLMGQGMDLMAAARKGYDDILDLGTLATVARLFGVSAYARPVGLGSRDADLRQRHVDVFGGLLDQGKQVIAGVGGHFVKIENIEDDGLVINDPATSRRSDEKIPWPDTAGFVKSIMVVG
ncbi:MAG: peptidoglycan-binding domain-containing protein [Ilumatobacter sp.]|uniref:peptidoglycan-binding domain-containing protein n=1 Tax=Ilumatobacter sp. TaxID=1967498 RepID=UPI00261E7188|nr:peptidoglycan-binding domain-containing protein [Ilumatobacter sp.]MDJ0768058.1 peptidoglycan-binding domain-containing protein [Ilumatobacter sp.]